MPYGSASGHPRLHRRGATYYFRAAIPRGLRIAVGRREVWRSLCTKDRNEALRRVRVAAVEFDKELDSHRATINQSAAPLPNVCHIPPLILDKASIAEGYTLADLILEYMADPGRSRTDKTRMGYEIIFGALSEMLGPGRPIAAVTREDCRAVQQLLQKIPANARKLYPGLTLQQAAVRGTEEGRRTLSPGTVNSYLNNLSSLFRWAVQEGKITR
jgi:hypothetical protein